MATTIDKKRKKGKHIYYQSKIWGNDTSANSWAKSWRKRGHGVLLEKRKGKKTAPKFSTERNVHYIGFITRMPIK